MKYLLLTFDLEEFENVFHQFRSLNKEEIFDLERQSLNNILNILKEKQIKGTFFTTFIFAKRHTNIIKRLIVEGHELASHGYSHNHNYKKLSEVQSLKYLEQSKNKLEKEFKVKIKGFRAPQMQHPPYIIIKKAGFLYDSSLHPTFLPGYYNNFFKKRHFHTKDKIIISPVSVTPLLRFPISWIWFRNFGLNYEKICSKLCFINTSYINLYFHAWDFLDLEKIFSKKLNKIIVRNSGKVFINKFNKYLDWLNKNKIKSCTISNYVENV